MEPRRAWKRFAVLLLAIGCSEPNKYIPDPDGATGTDGPDSGGAGANDAPVDLPGGDVRDPDARGGDLPNGRDALSDGPAEAPACKGCLDGTRCLAGDDVMACGTAGQACRKCEDMNQCTADRCTNGTCAGDKLTGDQCSTGVCVGGVCECGGEGQPCCAQGTVCQGGRVCQNNRCGNCGSEGLPCCSGDRCAAGTICNTGTAKCEGCGAVGQLCCTSGQCGTGLNCNGGHCASCGASGESCCEVGNPCKPNLSCGAGMRCECGGIGQACCNGATCSDDGDRCNGQEICQGTCQHQNPIICPTPDRCHLAGQCLPSTGTCTNPPKPDGPGCNVWAVGPHVVAHWNGDSWSVDENSSAFLRDVLVESASSIWGVGACDDCNPQVGGLDHWTRWPADFSESRVDNATLLKGMWGRGGDLWAVGTVTAAGSTSGTVSHLTGTAVTKSVAKTASLIAVWGNSNELWGIGLGDDLVTPVAVFWLKSTFPGTAPVAKSLAGIIDPGAIWGSSATDVWMAGNQGSSGAVAHWTSWGDATPIVVKPAGSTSLQALWASSASDVWAVGEQGTVGVVVHWDNGWTSSPPAASAVNRMRALTDVWGTSSSDVWAVGTAEKEGCVVHWDGKSWSSPNCLSTYAFQAISGLAP